MENNQPKEQKIHPVAWTILVVGIALLAVGAYYFLTQEDVNTNNANIVAVTKTAVGDNINTAANTNEVTNMNTEVDTSDWLTYENEEYGYAFKYPSDMKVDDYRDYGEIYGLTWIDNKIVPKPGGIIPLSINVYQNSTDEVRQAFEEKYIMSSWVQTMIGPILGETAQATFSENFFHYYYVFSRSGYTILIETTDPTNILPTFYFK